MRDEESTVLSEEGLRKKIRADILGSTSMEYRNFEQNHSIAQDNFNVARNVIRIDVFLPAYYAPLRKKYKMLSHGCHAKSYHGNTKAEPMHDPTNFATSIASSTAHRRPILTHRTIICTFVGQ